MRISIVDTLVAVTALSALGLASPIPSPGKIIERLEKRYQEGSPWIWRGDYGEAFDKRAPEPERLKKRYQEGSPWIWRGDYGEAFDKRAPEPERLKKRYQEGSPWIWRGDYGEAFDKRAPAPKAD